MENGASRGWGTFLLLTAVLYVAACGSPTTSGSDVMQEPDEPVEASLDGLEDDGAAMDVPLEPELPPLTTLAEGFHVPLVLPGDGEPFSLIVASDPQLWWNFVDGEGGVSDGEVEGRNQLHIDAMNALIGGEYLPEGHKPPLGVVMNGDLTEYGRWVQWDAYYRLYEGVNAPIWDGLGNHDYQNNNFFVSNGCAMDAFDFEDWKIACDAGSSVTLWGESACDVAEHILEFWGWCASDAMRRMRYWLQNREEYLYDWDEGSAAYSWELGDYHFVQLHNAPDYEVPETTICSAVPWVKRDLKAAFERGKKIVLNMHKPISSNMKPHLEGYQYNIVAIFYGHHHRNAGYTGDFTVGGIAIPRFYSGSVEWNLFALAHFEADRLTVTSIDSNTGVPVHHGEAQAYGNLNGGKASAPFTYVFPVHGCSAGRIPDGKDGPCIIPELDTPPIELCY